MASIAQSRVSQPEGVPIGNDVMRREIVWGKNGVRVRIHLPGQKNARWIFLLIHDKEGVDYVD